MITKEYPIIAMGKPRMTRADKWKQRPEVMRYRAFKDEVRLHNISLPESGYHITFVLPMPQSWSKKKKAEMNGKPHQQKPDKDKRTATQKLASLAKSHSVETYLQLISP